MTIMSVPCFQSAGYRHDDMDEPRNILMGLAWQETHTISCVTCCPSQGPSPIKVFRGFAFGPAPQSGLAYGLDRAHSGQIALLNDQQQRYSVDMATVAGRGDSERARAPFPMNISVKRTWDCCGRSPRTIWRYEYYGSSPGVAMPKEKYCCSKNYYRSVI